MRAISFTGSVHHRQAAKNHRLRGILKWYCQVFLPTRASIGTRSNWQRELKLRWWELIVGLGKRESHLPTMPAALHGRALKDIQ